MLHPFLKPTKLDVEHFCPEKWPKKQEIIDGTSPIKWEEVVSFLKMHSLAEVDVGLRTTIGGIKKELSNENSANKLVALTEQLNIIDFLQNAMKEPILYCTSSFILNLFELAKASPTKLQDKI